MEKIFNDLFSNTPLIMAAAAWLIAQVTKLIITLFVYPEEISPNILVSSGGMPSSHTATVCALTTTVAISEGISSPLFAVCAILSFIVMYDATGVRRSAGEQAETLNKIIDHLSSKDHIEGTDAVREIFGHTPLQVAVGAVFGIAVPIISKYLFGIGF